MVKLGERIALAAWVTLLLIGASVASARPRAAHGAQACPDVFFIGARGSGESSTPKFHGMGPEVNQMAKVVQSVLGENGLTMSLLADTYPADSVQDLMPSRAEAVEMLALGPVGAVALYLHRNYDKYNHSINEGVATAVADAKQKISACPNASLIFAGYSQGAMVMHQAERRLAAAGDTGVIDATVGTLLLGDGDRVPYSQARLFGTSARRGEGIQTYLDPFMRHDVELPGNTAEICNDHDIVCDFNLAILKTLSLSRIIKYFKNASSVHTSYFARDGSLLTRAATWIAGGAVSLIQARFGPRVVPATGPTLAYEYDTAGNSDDGDLSFDDWSGANSEAVDIEYVLPLNITSYRCVVLDLNEDLAGGDGATLARYLNAGGTVVALGEHSDGDGFDQADATLNSLATTLGVGISLNDDQIDEGDTVTNNIESSSLTSGVGAIGYNWASTLSVSGSAEPLVESADGSATIIAAQSVASGTFVMSGDSNAFSDNNDGFYDDDDNGQLVEDLCP